MLVFKAVKVENKAPFFTFLESVVEFVFYNWI